MSEWSAAELAGHVANHVLTDRPLRLRRLPCACGGQITADAADPGPEVLRHNRTPRHAGWWMRLEMED